MADADRNLGLGKSIRAMRKMTGYTQGQLGARVGLSDSSVGAIERGTQPLTPEILRSLLQAMGFTMAIQFKRNPPGGQPDAGTVTQEALL